MYFDFFSGKSPRAFLHEGFFMPRNVGYALIFLMGHSHHSSTATKAVPAIMREKEVRHLPLLLKP